MNTTTTMRVMVRKCDDGFVRALVDVPDGLISLLSVPTSLHSASEEVRIAFHALTLALFRQVVKDADPSVNVESIRTVAPGAEADSKPH